MDEPVIDELNGTHCKISFSVSKNEITAALENQHQQLIKEASIPGFRKGKAPPRLVTRLVSPEQRDQLLSRVLLKTFLSATKILGVNPATPPAIRAKIQIASQPSKDSADFEATFEVFKELGALQLGISRSKLLKLQSAKTISIRCSSRFDRCIPTGSPSTAQHSLVTEFSLT